MSTQAERFFNLFVSLPRVYGTLRITTTHTDKKQLGDYVTKQGQVSVELWNGHLDGTQAIGLVPIRDDATCLWGCIDVDRYDTDLVKVTNTVAERKLPLIACRTKSGGVHLLCFASEPVEAKAMRERLNLFAAALSYAGSEIFPKQERLVSSTDGGSWLNMPYFRGMEGGRYAVRPGGQPVAPDDFLDLAESLRQPREWFLKPVWLEGPAFSDGPPCLEYLAANGGFGEGNRNNLLFAAGVYAKLKYGQDGVREALVQINQDVCRPPLAAEELRSLTSGVGKGKNYRFRCKTEPLKSNCNAGLCRLRAFGVGRDGTGGEGEQANSGTGGGDGSTPETFPRLGQMRKLLTKPPIWYWDTQGGKTLELSADDLQSSKLFQKRCIEILNLAPTMPKSQYWTQYINIALSQAVEIEAPEDATDEGQIKQLLEKYCNGHTQAQSKKELLMGKPWTHDGKVYFRLREFTAFVDQQKFRSPLMVAQKLGALFLNWKFQEKQIGIPVGTDKKHRNIRCWVAPAFEPEVHQDVPESIQDSGKPF